MVVLVPNTQDIKLVCVHLRCRVGKAFGNLIKLSREKPEGIQIHFFVSLGCIKRNKVISVVPKQFKLFTSIYETTCSHIRKSVCSVQWRQDKVWTVYSAVAHQKKIEFKRESTEIQVTPISTAENSN